ncbi:MAG: mechanosensitive ion channel family protein [Bacteroidales bacterium]|nr:mechanosensitive ion channel family protein [Bacteroidales bacterium]
MINIIQTEQPVSIPDSLRIATENFVAQMKTAPDVLLESLAEKALQFGLKVLAALVIYLAGAWFIRRVKKILKAVFARKGTEGTLSSFILSFTSISLYLLLAIITIGALGINTTSLAALLAAGGMALGMALSGTAQNFSGGIMILVFKPFKIGDFISAQGYTGTVTDVSMVSTSILTTDNRVVVIPNGALSNGNIDNFSAKPLRRVDWTVSVSYESDADACMEAIREILASDKRILDSSTPGAADPFVALASLNSNDISFTVRAWTRGENYWDVYFNGNRNFYTILPQKGFSFAYPHMDVTIKS